MTDIMYNSDRATLSNVVHGCISTWAHQMCIWKILQHEYDIETLIQNGDAAIIGHSIGENAGLTAAQLFQCDEDALAITLKYTHIMTTMTTDDQAMAAVVTDPKDIGNNIANKMP